MSGLRTATEEGPNRVRVELAGDLDVATVPAFEMALGRVESGSKPLLVLDLRQLEFIDSVGLHAVVRASERSKQAGQRFVIVRGQTAVQRVFKMTMLDQRFAFVDDPGLIDEKAAMDDAEPSG